MNVKTYPFSDSEVLDNSDDTKELLRESELNK